MHRLSNFIKFSKRHLLLTGLVIVITVICSGNRDLSLKNTAKYKNNGVSVSYKNASVQCKNIDITIGEIEQKCKKFIPDFGPVKSITLKQALSSNYRNIQSRIMRITVVLADGRKVRIGADTQKSDSGLRINTLFSGLNEKLGKVHSVTLSLRNKNILYPETTQLSPEKEAENSKYVNMLLNNIKHNIIEGIPDKYYSNTFSKTEAKNFKSLCTTLESKDIEYRKVPVKTSSKFRKDDEVSLPDNSAELVVTFPKNTKDVVHIINIAKKYNIPWVARGKGTSLTGSPVPMYDSIIVDMSKYMKNIYSFKEQDSYATIIAEPGAVNGDVDKYINKKWRFSPKPASYLISSVGGNLANNAVGMNGAKEGATADYINAVELVTPYGNRLILRRNNSRECTLLNLLAGSEGRMGIITKIELILSKTIPEDNTCTILYKFDNPVKALEAVTDIHKSGIVPMKMEFMDTIVLKGINNRQNVNSSEFYRNTDSALLIQLADTNQKRVLRRKNELKKIMGKYKKYFTKLSAANKKITDELITTRIHLFPIMVEYMNYKYSFDEHLDMDPIIPLSCAVEFYNGVQKIALKHKIKIPFFSHAGDMICHPLIFYSSKNRKSCETALKVMKEIDELALDLGGRVSGEHGIGFKLNYFMDKKIKIDDQRIMEAVLAALSPGRLANPGKIFPDEKITTWLKTVFCQRKLSKYTKNTQ
ncbi:MAG: FAD-binding protein [Victivallales bacterium]|nr:FAD-binding protein [Victivallales bacterium]